MGRYFNFWMKNIPVLNLLGMMQIFAAFRSFLLKIAQHFNVLLLMPGI
jgi:hypothetical protein